MPKIKNRETHRDIKVLDKASVAGERMKNAFIRSKDTAGNLMDDGQITPEEYAEDRVQYAAEDIAHDVGHAAAAQGKRVIHRGRDAVRERLEHPRELGRDVLNPQREPISNDVTNHPPQLANTPESEIRGHAQQIVLRNHLSISEGDAPSVEAPSASYEEIAEVGPIFWDQLPSPEGGAGPKIWDEPSEVTEAAEKSPNVYPAYSYVRPQESGKGIKTPATRLQDNGHENKQPMPMERGRQLAIKRAEKKAEAARAEQCSPSVDDSAPKQPADVLIRNASPNLPHKNSETRRATGAILNHRGKTSIKTVERTERPIRKSAHSTRITGIKAAEKTAKASQKAIKTAERTSKTAIKTAEPTAKAAQKATETAARTARRAAQTTQELTRITMAAAKTVAKALEAAVKAIISGVKELVAAIASGGWTTVMIVVIICLIGALVASPFGIFFSGETTPGSGVTVSAAVSQLNYEFNSYLSGLQSEGFDNVSITGSMADWPEVLAVFAVKIAASENENAMDVVTLDSPRLSKLRDVFWDMNQVTSTVETISHPDTDSDDEIDDSWTERNLRIMISAKTAEQMKTEYSFSEMQKEILDELLQNRYMLVQLIGNTDYLAPDAEAVLRNLPQDISEVRQETVRAACSLVGKIDYFWGGKSLVIGWDLRWGQPTLVTAPGNWSSGTYQPYGLDCSGFVDWAYYNGTSGAYYPSVGGGGTYRQYANSTPITWEEALPGDLVFFSDISHVGMVAGRDEAGNLLVVHCSNGVQITGASYFYSVRRPNYLSSIE